VRKFKTMPASLKAPPTYHPDEPEFSAIVSVFNNRDLGGDIVRPGAFTDTIAAWKQSGEQIPVLWSHRFDEPEYNIGAVKEIEEVEPGDPRIPQFADPWIHANGGLWVRAGIDVESGAKAQTVWHLLTKRRVTQFSFAYETLEERQTPDGNELLKLWLYEVGPTFLGMNPLTELVGAKTDQPEEAGTPPHDPSPAPEPEAPEEETRKPAPLADFRLRCDIAARWHAYAND
jgi:uncharacterized protein